MIVSQYFTVARFMPAVICSAPLLLLYFSFLRVSMGPFFDAFLKVQWLGDISTAAVLMFLLAMIGLTIAKDIFERRWFRSDETKMPTTEFMLYSSGEYSSDFKTRLPGGGPVSSARLPRGPRNVYRKDTKTAIMARISDRIAQVVLWRFLASARTCSSSFLSSLMAPWAALAGR